MHWMSISLAEALLKLYLPAQSLHTIVALGDSYTTAVGAGSLLNPKENQNCRRYTDSFVFRLRHDPELGFHDIDNSSMIVCAGAMIPEVNKEICTMVLKRSMIASPKRMSSPLQ